MARLVVRLRPPRFIADLAEFFAFLRLYIKLRGYKWFSGFEGGKDVVVDLLYRQRGKYSRPFLHFGTIGLVFVVITLGPFILARAEEENQRQAAGGVLTSNAYGNSFNTLQAEEVKQYRGGEVTEYVVQEGDTVSSIAQKYGLEPSTILWENNLTAQSKLKPGQTLRILPVDGIRHKVQRGETIYTIAKKYGLDESSAQAIVDYPFNEFLNDETFELATGQYLMVPGGIKAEAAAPQRTVARFTPDAGAVAATGNFVWPASGQISQGYAFYHKGIDIASRGAGAILAADAGTVAIAGWDSSGYGNRVIIDHGNGMSTLYGHLSAIQVQSGQRVNRGDVIGQMGSTGRSTGTHLHFEIRQGGVLLNPLGLLR